jgi:hypothetical protein
VQFLASIFESDARDFPEFEAELADSQILGLSEEFSRGAFRQFADS